ncbi:2-succinyl-5-enolpyruvyl-6-hydroxy-3-cyclohexene-1-carboxylic-acid synthase [Dyadobacter sp. CY312]|uniref:2-succinyl-5-enolpyruvyl-6-hydroxy-3- cyclohexene-1-carboxylic-acid synthase n=1 Tax=Dyadobacter sp. CY312 TaxID=2907303 RepID=UPI001F348E8F|nr:2-succinyl-5-enolpyruvyl-6-hydroxy-3-cyclohexene-1-carboxylic-acid synthase [Dyadobacter sp. CY312]MCE7039318.1 2-succinyl-5-enolpyruvyl-6-hydroxy-3-cyclohexene-1-carboxylic-acid synthase [Dyadobacter sp. CY312]
MAVLQPLVDLAAICYLHGVRHVVLSPGSRSAALTLAFSRHKDFEMHPVMDERSAGFIALGIAQQTGVPVVLICTSGSAAYNFAPAIAEAFFQQIPLLVLTADRPKEWTHQFDGQTIYQTEIYGKHVKKFFEFPSDYAHSDAIWAINRISNEAVNLAGNLPFGPVHINVPIREPFYPLDTDSLLAPTNLRITVQTVPEPALTIDDWNVLLDEWDDSGRILIVGGQHQRCEKLNHALSKITEELDVPVVADSIANLSGSELFIHHHDLILASNKNQEELVPDLLITYGLSMMSKELKTFLRDNPARKHWHIGNDGVWADPLKSVTRQIAVNASWFFETIFEKIDYQLFVQNADAENDPSYMDNWRKKEQSACREQEDFLTNLTSLTDLSAINSVISNLSGSNQLHVGNSMPIRYVNALGRTDKLAGLFCNRGTSGIDGSLSTAIGAALVNNVPTTLIIGDVSFLYDRNGLLLKTLPSNLKIVVINNGGGNIFRMIDGPARQPELEDYFETKHSFTARRTAEDAGLVYMSASSPDSLEHSLHEFNLLEQAGLLEVFTDPEENRLTWKKFKSITSD